MPQRLRLLDDPVAGRSSRPLRPRARRPRSRSRRGSACRYRRGIAAGPGPWTPAPRARPVACRTSPCRSRRCGRHPSRRARPPPPARVLQRVGWGASAGRRCDGVPPKGAGPGRLRPAAPHRVRRRADPVPQVVVVRASSPLRGLQVATRGPPLRGKPSVRISVFRHSAARSSSSTANQPPMLPSGPSWRSSSSRPQVRPYRGRCRRRPGRPALLAHG